MIDVNVKKAKKCALCKYWYDPTNSAIEPKIPSANIWSMDETQKRKCLKKNSDMRAWVSCPKYECKLDI